MEKPEIRRVQPPRRVKRVRLRWNRIIMTALIILAIVAGTIYATHLTRENTRDSAEAPLEKSERNSIPPDQRLLCRTHSYPCPNQTCPPGENCLL